jgi:hypothetical protein
MAINAASWHMAVISAPEHPLVCTNQFKNQKLWNGDSDSVKEKVR